jgi:sugar phosphate permease
MGYSTGVTHLLGVPPVVFAVITSLIISWLSDKYKVRAPAIIFQCCLCIIGLMMTGHAKANLPRYFGLWFGFSGCQVQGHMLLNLIYVTNCC